MAQVTLPSDPSLHLNVPAPDQTKQTRRTGGPKAKLIASEACDVKCRLCFRARYGVHQGHCKSKIYFNILCKFFLRSHKFARQACSREFARASVQIALRKCSAQVLFQKCSARVLGVSCSANLLCASCPAQVLVASCSAQALCASVLHASIFAPVTHANCLAQALCASCSVQVALVLCKLLCASVLQKLLCMSMLLSESALRKRSLRELLRASDCKGSLQFALCNLLCAGCFAQERVNVCMSFSENARCLTSHPGAQWSTSSNRFAHRPRRSPQRVAVAKVPSFCTLATPIPAETRAPREVARSQSVCASTTPSVFARRPRQSPQRVAKALSIGTLTAPTAEGRAGTAKTSKSRHFYAIICRENSVLPHRLTKEV